MVNGGWEWEGDGEREVKCECSLTPKAKKLCLFSGDTKDEGWGAWVHFPQSEPFSQLPPTQQK